MEATSRGPDIKRLLEYGGLPGLGPGPRAGVLSEAALTQAGEPIFKMAELHVNSHELVWGLLLVWHDHLDAAHLIGQGIENADGSFLHGIVHRREPDYENAAYWFRRARGHAAFPKIAKRVAEWLTANSEHALLAELIPNGQWDALAFINRCEQAAGMPMADPQTGLLRKIQGIEFEVLLEHWWQS